MNTLRHFFIGDDLDDLEVLEEELEAAGISTPQIYVLTNDDTGAANHRHLHEVQSLMKKDIIHSMEVGALIGIAASLLILLVASILDLPEKTVGWVPYVFLSIVALGFCTWEGGLFGIQETNARFQRFEVTLASGKHLFFVDVKQKQEEMLKSVVKKHPTLGYAGVERGPAEWIINFRMWMFRFIDRNLYSYSQVRQ